MMTTLFMTMMRIISTGHGLYDPIEMFFSLSNLISVARKRHYLSRGVLFVVLDNKRLHI